MSANLSPRIAIALLAIVTLLASVAFAQTTISTGSIQGTVTDQSGAVVAGAKVTITDKATGRVVSATTGSSGTYTSGALTPGNYTVRVEAPGFKTIEQTVTAQVGVTTSGNIKMQLGQATQVVQVEGSTLEVNTEQATVQGVLTPVQIENLPVNGRNFLDLAQLEPGVQIQDGGTFDPTKKGFAAISFGGRFGRTARIEVDGVDTSDETVGTTTQDIPQGAIQEFQIGESMLDLSTELTSSGSVNVVTKSGYERLSTARASTTSATSLSTPISPEAPTPTSSAINTAVISAAPSSKTSSSSSAMSSASSKPSRFPSSPARPLT